MKKITLPALALAALIIASCAKEKDGYDKNLTKEEWNLSEASLVNETFIENVFNNGTPNTTSTNRNTTIIKNGELTDEDYQKLTMVGFQDQFTKDTEISDFSLKYKFEQEGTFISNTSQKLTSTIHEEDGVAPSTTTVTADGTTSSNSGIWSWQNTGDQKSLLSFDLGEFQVEEITKDNMSLKLNTKRVQVSKPSASETETETQTQTFTLTFSK